MLMSRREATMLRRKRAFKITGPKIKVTNKGLNVTKPQARIDIKVRLDLSSKGISGSVKTR
jgi:hypothetical protein